MPPQLLAKFDQMFMSITQEAGAGVQGLLEVFFSFLQRRTDFFHEAAPGDKMGFPPDYAEGLIYQFFKKYQEIHYKRVPPKTNELKKLWNEYN